MIIDVQLSTRSVKEAIRRLKQAKKDLLGKMVDELLFASCEYIRTLANAQLELSDLNAGFIAEIENGWQPIKKQTDGSYLLSNYGRGYSAEFGIGIKGQGSYTGFGYRPAEVPQNYEYNVKTRYKNTDGSWIFRVDDIYSLDITRENVMPNSVTGEVNYEEGRTIRTDGQKAVMFCYNGIMDFIDGRYAEKIWKEITAKYWG